MADTNNIVVDFIVLEDSEGVTVIAANQIDTLYQQNNHPYTNITLRSGFRISIGISINVILQKLSDLNTGRL